MDTKKSLIGKEIILLSIRDTSGIIYNNEDIRPSIGKRFILKPPQYSFWEYGALSVDSGNFWNVNSEDFILVELYESKLWKALNEI